MRQAAGFSQAELAARSGVAQPNIAAYETERRRPIGMRHRLAHDDDAVDYDLVWGVVATHAATLRARVESPLDNVWSVRNLP